MESDTCFRLNKHVHVDTIVYFVIQSGQVSEGGSISVSRHVKLQLSQYLYYIENKVKHVKKGFRAVPMVARLIPGFCM